MPNPTTYSPSWCVGNGGGGSGGGGATVGNATTSTYIGGTGSTFLASEVSEYGGVSLMKALQLHTVHYSCCHCVALHKHNITCFLVCRMVDMVAAAGVAVVLAPMLVRVQPVLSMQSWSLQETTPALAPYTTQFLRYLCLCFFGIQLLTVHLISMRRCNLSLSFAGRHQLYISYHIYIYLPGRLIRVHSYLL